MEGSSMSKFKLHRTLVTIDHINARKEGPEDDKELAVDLKLSTMLGADVLDFFEPALVDALFLGTAVRNPMMGPVTMKHELEHYRLEAMGSTHFGVRVKKFVMEPTDGLQVLLTFGVSFKPSGDEVARLAEYLQDGIEISLEPSDEELNLEGAKP
jgi:hypothetical protein